MELKSRCQQLIRQSVVVDNAAVLYATGLKYEAKVTNLITVDSFAIKTGRFSSQLKGPWGVLSPFRRAPSDGGRSIRRLLRIGRGHAQAVHLESRWNGSLPLLNFFKRVVPCIRCNEEVFFFLFYDVIFSFLSPGSALIEK